MKKLIGLLLYLFLIAALVSGIFTDSAAEDNGVPDKDTLQSDTEIDSFLYHQCIGGASGRRVVEL